MANSVLKLPAGPIWPLGNIVVTSPGTPVSLMSLTDPSLYNAPETQSSVNSYEYTNISQQIIFQAIKAGVSHGTQNNTGNVYLVMYAARTGTNTGNRDDLGTLIWAFAPGSNLFLSSAPLSRNKWSPYALYVDADNANDGLQVSLLID
jgi:hypothetical protein